MNNKDVNYQVVFFGNFKDLDASPENMFKLLSIYKNDGFIPSTFTEIEVSSTIGYAKTINRPGFSKNGNFFINIATDRIDIICNNTSLITLDEFINDSDKYLKRILDEYNIKGSRISLVISRIYKISDIKSIFNQLVFDNVIEWNSSFVIRKQTEIKSINEKLNLVVNILKNTEINTYTKTDEVFINYDINTIHENNENRIKDVLIYLNKLKEVCIEVETTLKENNNANK